MGKPQFNTIVEKEAGEIKMIAAAELMRETTLSDFNDENTAYSPTDAENLSDYFTNDKAVENKFKNRNSKRLAGNDRIPNIALKHLPKNIIWQYTILFYNMLNLDYFPTIWKKAKVVAILKNNKDSTQPTNYRPISLLPNIGKIYEMLINDIIIKCCNKLNIIPENQYGFKAKHSTIHAINKIASDINWALNDYNCVGACLIDLEKAFDTVWIDGLLFKFKEKKFPMQIVKLIWNMISNRSFITINDTKNQITNTLSETVYKVQLIHLSYLIYIQAIYYFYLDLVTLNVHSLHLQMI